MINSDFYDLPNADMQVFMDHMIAFAGDNICC